MVDYVEAHDRDGAPRIKGNGLLFVIDDIDYWADCSSVTLTQDEDIKHEWHGPISTNIGDWLFEVSGIQSTHPDSLWRFLWAHEYEFTDIIYAPHGNTEPSDEQPFFKATAAQVPSAPDLGGSAGEHTEQEFTVQFRLNGKPELITSI